MAAVRKKISVKSLSAENLKEIETNVLKLESLNRRADSVKAKIDNQKQGGLFAPNQLKEALPSSVLNKRRKIDNTVSEFARSQDSKLARGSLSSEKIRPQNADVGIVDGFIASLGIKNLQRKTAKGSLVSAAGRPVRNFDNEFTKLRNKTNRLEQSQRSLAKIMSKGGALVAGASGLTSLNGITSIGLGLASKIPLVGFVTGIAVTAALKVWDEHVKQYNAGGTRDRRKKVLAGDVSLIGVDNENAIFSGENLFFSNPQQLQGLPRGKSNTSDKREGQARFILRHQGSYEG